MCTATDIGGQGRSKNTHQNNDTNSLLRYKLVIVIFNL